MELLCKAMLYAAEKIARENGYILVAQEKRFADKDNFWGNVAAALMYARDNGHQKRLSYQYFKYIYPQFEEDRNEKYSVPKIELDLHFGNPRMTFYAHDDAGSCCLTYKRETHKFSEAQVFGDLGFPRAELCKKYIEEYIREHSDSRNQ